MNDVKVAVYFTDAFGCPKHPAWEHSVKIAEDVDGSTLNKWVHSYASEFNEKNTWYAPFELWYSREGERFGGLTGSECHDFVWWGM